MTYIRVEPDEMTSTASVLRTTADELAGIGGEVQSQCCGCCLPATVEAQALALASEIEAALAGVSADLWTQSTDLITRGSAAAADSLATAASSASGPALAGDGSPTTVTVGSPAWMLDYLSGRDTPTTTSIVGGWNPTWPTTMSTAPIGSVGGLGGASLLDLASPNTNIWVTPSRSELMNAGGGYTYMSPSEYTQRGYDGLNE